MRPGAPDAEVSVKEDSPPPLLGSECESRDQEGAAISGNPVSAPTVVIRFQPRSPSAGCMRRLRNCNSPRYEPYDDDVFGKEALVGAVIPSGPRVVCVGENVSILRNLNFVAISKTDYSQSGGRAGRGFKKQAWAEFASRTGGGSLQANALTPAPTTISFPPTHLSRPSVQLKRMGESWTDLSVWGTTRRSRKLRQRESRGRRPGVEESG